MPNEKGLVQNTDGAYDICIGPEASDGMEYYFRLYDPLEPWFDKTWRPSDFELVE